MRKILATAIPILLAITACTSNYGGDYTITVNFADDAINGHQLYLTSYDSGDTIDSVPIANRAATLKGSVDTAYVARLIVDGKREAIVVESGEITVDWANHTSGGATLNDKFQELNTRLNAIESEYDKITEDFNKKLITEEQANEKGRDIQRRLDAELKKAYDENRDNAIGPWALNNWLIDQDFTGAQIDSLLATAPAHYKTMKRMVKAKNDAVAKESTAVGKHFTDFEVISPAGEKQRLSDFAGNGDVIVLDFWASWCGPCRVEIEKSLKPIYKKYGDKGLKVVGLAVWDKPADTMDAIDRLEIPWPVIIGNHYMTEQTDLYGVAGIPHIIVIDGDGTIVARGLNGEDLIRYVDDLMNVNN